MLNEFTHVVVKFMNDSDQFDREIGSRNLRPSARHSACSERPFVVPCITYFDSRESCEIDVHYKRDIKENKDVFGHDLMRYPYAIVMPKADRNFDSIYRQEVPSMLRIRAYMEEVAKSLQQLHATGKIHADIKLLNIVRLNGVLCLVDMDAHRSIENDVCCVKFSSGILPPETICKLNNEHEVHQHMAYWQETLRDYETIECIGREANVELPDAISAMLEEERGVETGHCESRLHFYGTQSPTLRDLLTKVSGSIAVFYGMWTGMRRNEALWKKVRPHKNKNGDVYVVRAFKDRQTNGLPYGLVRASTALDMWSFGVLLYKLCTKSDLFCVNDDTGDLLNGEDFSKLIGWDLAETPCKEKINSVDNKLARDLLSRLLAVDPNKRPQAMSEVLAHDFFKADYSSVNGKLEIEVKGLREEIKSLKEKQDHRHDGNNEWFKDTLRAKIEDMEAALKDREVQLRMWKMPLSVSVSLRNWPALIYRVNNAPDAVPKDFLHLVCKHGPSLGAIDSVTRANANLVRERNGMDELPIHVACCYGSERSIIERFVRLHPESVFRMDICGMTPLDNAQTKDWTHCKADQRDVIEYLREKSRKDYFDDMTGFPKKSAFGEWAHIPPPGFSAACAIILFIDVSGFKAVNEHSGHEVGDIALKKYATDIKHICERIPASPARGLHALLDLFRVGGDEFVVVGKCACHEYDVEPKRVWGSVFKQLVIDLSDLVFEDCNTPPRYSTFLRIGCSAGEASSVQALLREADALQIKVKERIGLERGQSISLIELREKCLQNYEICEQLRE